MAFLNYENKRSESGKKMKVHFDLPEDDDSMDHQKHSSPSNSSESSLDSDDSDKDESKYTGYGSPVWSFQGGSSTPPPVPPPGYDPARIPASVFSARPASPMEWSVASNESLFSIHIGNSSFSRDHAFAMNNKSGELLPWANDLPSMPTTLAPVQEVSKEKIEERHSSSSSDSDIPDDTADLALEDDHKKTSNIETVAESVVEDDSHDTLKEESQETLAKVETTTTLDKTPDEDHSKEAVVPKEEPKGFPSDSYRSVESNMSNSSFQFPILTNDGVRVSSETVDSEKQERNEKHQQQLQPPPQNPLPPPNPKTEKAPKYYCCRSWWCCLTCFRCSSPCY